MLYQDADACKGRLAARFKRALPLAALWLLSVHPALGAAQAAAPADNAATARLGIWSDAKERDLAGLVTVQLSSNPGLALLERDDLGKIAQEAALDEWLGDAKSVGPLKLEGVDALLFLSAKGAGKSAGVRMRLVAVKEGVVIADTVVPATLGPEAAAKGIADRASERMRKFENPKAPALALSFLNLRSTLPGAEWSQLDLEMSTLFESRLASEPGVFLLDRRTIDTLEQEKGLGTDETPFSDGVWLVDGRIEPEAAAQPHRFQVELRLRRLSPPAEVALNTHADQDDLPAAVDAIARQLLLKLDRIPGKQPWNREKESAQFSEEAAWAFREGETEPALQAIGAARALGSQTPDLLAMRISILCPQAAPAPESYVDEFELPRNIEAKAHDASVELFTQALDDWDIYSRQNGQDHLQYFDTAQDMFVRPVELKNLLIFTGLRLLRDEIALRGTAAAGALRDRVRDLAGFDPAHGKIPGNWKVQNAFLPYLARSPQELLSAYQEALTGKNDPTAVLLRLRGIGAACILPALEPDAAKREALFAAFQERLRENPETELSFLYLRTKGTKSEAERIAGSRNFVDAVYAKRETLMRNGTFANYAAAVGLLDADDVKAGRARLLSYYLEAASGLPSTGAMDWLWKPVAFPPEAAPELWKRFNAYRTRSLDALKAAHAENYSNWQAIFAVDEQQFAVVFPQIAAGDSAAAHDALKVTQYWEPETTNGDAVSLDVKPTGDTACVATMGAGQGGIWAVNLRTMRSRKLPLPLVFGVGTEMLASRNAVFAFLKGSGTGPGLGALERYDLRTGATETRNTVGFHQQDNFAAGDDVYLNLWTSGDSGLAKLHWPSGETSILASSRRRPGRNQFDDCANWLPGRCFAGPRGRICAMINGQPYYVREVAGKWERLFPPVDEKGPWPWFSGDYFWGESDAGTQILLYSARGDLVLIDPAQPAPQPLMISDLTAAALPDWRKQAVWNMFDRTEIVNYNGLQIAAHNGELFVLCRKPFREGGGYSLRWYRKTGPRDGLSIPIAFTNPPPRSGDDYDRDRATAFDVNGFSVFSRPEMWVCDPGIIFSNHDRGFWFLPYGDIEAYLKANHR